jgi:hypothetical protein
VSEVIQLSELTQRRALLLGGGLLLASCAENAAPPPAETPAEPQRIELSEAESWSPADPSSDPFGAYAADRIRCSSAAIRPEGTWIEVNTTTCNYSTLVTGFTLAARAGSQIRGELAWATLAAIDPAVATLAFALGEEVLWTHEVPIPGEANLVTVEFELPGPVPAGSSLFFHIRNHGYNSWQLSPLALEEGGYRAAN